MPVATSSSGRRITSAGLVSLVGAAMLCGVASPAGATNLIAGPNILNNGAFRLPKGETSATPTSATRSLAGPSPAITSRCTHWPGKVYRRPREEIGRAHV